MSTMLPDAAFMLVACLLVGAMVVASPAAAFEKDVLTSSAGEVGITFIGHGTLALDLGGMVVHVDPWTRLADYSTLPKADLLLVTHAHRDHLDLEAIAAVRTPDTVLVANAEAAAQIPGAVAMANGETYEKGALRIDAVPAYNIVHRRDSGEPFHPKSRDNGYVLTFGDLRILVAGDTENTPELKALEGIDVAFLPMNLPYTMTPAMVADAARALRPKVLYPYHYGETDPQELVRLLADEPAIEVRVRSMR